MPVIHASPPHFAFSRDTAVLLVACSVLVATLSGVVLGTRYGQRKLAQRRVKCVDEEARFTCVGRGFFVKRGLPKDATVSPADVLAKARLATPTPLSVALAKRSSTPVRLVKLQGRLEVESAHFVIRPVRAPLRPSPLRAVLSASDPVIIECVDPPTKSATPCALGFDYLFTSPIEEYDDERDSHYDSMEPDTSSWSSVCDGSRLSIALPVLQPAPSSAPLISQQTIDYASSAGLVGNVLSPARPAGHVKSAARSFKPSKVLSGKENWCSDTRIPRRPALRAG
ncbi:hypothetical protein B0H17DRAFT_1129611 [Mycena rosella]|uniref:Uncharacterized protein n=1 Tax=Mycena rosella TaxID=1033263 RepID=A0AAD7DTB1_MYCRO|nr:hypothetical protein B0H17DRAFT_1129611 [Mycena rosella]